MQYSKKIFVTAVFMTAVAFMALMISGCCTSRDINEVKSRLANLERQNRTTEKFVNRLDSLLSTGAEADTKLRNELRFSVDELQQQMTALLTNYNDLMARISNLVDNKPVTHVIYSSPGAQQDSTSKKDTTSAVLPPPPGPAYSINCDSTYDESFLSVRRGEYEKGVDNLLYFLKNCPNHPNDENAHYWLGESYYSLKKYKESAVEFEYVMNKYPNSVNIDLILFKLARCKQELGLNKEAKALYQRLADEYPGTLKGEEAKERLKDFK